jgi:hypothetical protein
MGGSLERWFVERDQGVAPLDIIIFTETEMGEWDRMTGDRRITRHLLNEIVGVYGLGLRGRGFPKRQAWLIPRGCFRMCFANQDACRVPLATSPRTGGPNFGGQTLVASS